MIFKGLFHIKKKDSENDFFLRFQENDFLNQQTTHAKHLTKKQINKETLR